MQNSLEQDFDVMTGRLADLEKNIIVMQENITVLSHQIKETQHFLIKLAKNQHDISKRVTHWPFIAVPEGDNEE